LTKIDLLTCLKHIFKNIARTLIVETIQLWIILFYLFEADKLKLEYYVLNYYCKKKTIT